MSWWVPLCKNHIKIPNETTSHAYFVRYNKSTRLSLGCEISFNSTESISTLLFIETRNPIKGEPLVSDCKLHCFSSSMLIFLLLRSLQSNICHNKTYLDAWIGFLGPWNLIRSRHKWNSGKQTSKSKILCQFKKNDAHIENNNRWTCDIN